MCFSLMWVRDLLIWLVIIAAVWALIKLIVPWVLAKFSVDGGIIIQALNIVLWAFVIIAVIYFIFALIACLLSMGGGSFPLFPRGH